MPTSKERTYFLFLLLAGAAVLTFLVFKPFITTVVLAGVCAVLLQPLKERIRKYIIPSKGFAALATLLIGVLMLVIPLVLVGALVVSESRSAYTSLATGSTGLTIQQVTVSVGTWLEPYFPGAGDFSASIASEIQNYISRALDWLVQNAGSAFTSIIAVAIRVIIFLMTLYYLLKDGDDLRDLLTKRSPISEKEVLTIFDHLSKTLTGIIRGSLVIAIIQGTVSGIGYAIFGLPNPSLWGVTTAISALVPGAGTSLILTPAVIFLLATGHVGAGIGMALWALFMVGLIDNFLAPRLIGSRAGLHPLLILLSLIGGLTFYGPVGIFLGPLTVSLLFALYLTYSNAKTPEA